MRRFYLDRQTDVSGTSGTGAVVEGVQLSNGQCVVRWLTFLSSLTIYSSIEDVVAIHGHDGSTNLHWVDEQPSGPPTETERGPGWDVETTGEPAPAEFDEPAPLVDEPDKPEGQVLRMADDEPLEGEPEIPADLALLLGRKPAVQGPAPLTASCRRQGVSCLTHDGSPFGVTAAACDAVLHPAAA